MEEFPKTSEVTAKRRPVRNTVKEYKENLSLSERFALYITTEIGSAGFFVIILLFTIFWFTWNTFGPDHLRFDPFPAFVLWLFLSNVIQLFLLPLILIGQNLENKHTNLRAESDYEVNLKSERELELILKRLENQDEMLKKILTK